MSNCSENVGFFLPFIIVLFYINLLGNKKTIFKKEKLNFKIDHIQRLILLR